MKEMRSMSAKFDSLRVDVESIKKSRHRLRSRSRSPHRSRSYGGASSSSGRSREPSRSRSRSPHARYHRRRPGEDLPTSWADVDPATDLVDYSADVQFSDDEEDTADGAQLVEVSEDTHHLLTEACTRSVSFEKRKRTRGHYKLPKVDATRTPRVDNVMQALAQTPAKSADKELARLQTFVLDSLAPVSSILENVGKMTVQEVYDAASSAASLVRNASARISRLRREKFAASINKSLVLLVKEDKDFAEVAPNLFGVDFAKRAKEHLNQVKTLRQASSSFHHSEHYSGRKSLFRRGFPSGRGSVRGRGGTSKYYPSKSHQGDKDRQSEHGKGR